MIGMKFVLIYLDQRITGHSKSSQLQNQGDKAINDSPYISSEYR